jgi:hypothetical protein
MKSYKKLTYLLSLILVIITSSCVKEENATTSLLHSGESKGSQSISIYPHSDDFKKTQLHGEAFLGNRQSCTKCHGSDFAGGASKVSCKECHNYPHDLNWSNPTNHGKAYMAINDRQKDDIEDPLKRDFKQCLMCHENKQDPTGTFKERHPEMFVACNSCHADLPHGQKFLPGTSGTNLISHGDMFLGKQQTCTKCHGSDYAGGTTGVSCKDCHNYPHDITWANPKNHGAAYMAISTRQKDIKDPLKRNFKQCLMCHENKQDPTGTFKQRHPEMYVACNSCHADLPHGQKFLPGEGDAGSITHDELIAKDRTVLGSCFSCHLNQARQAPKPTPICLKCHEGYPFEPKPVEP